MVYNAEIWQQILLTGSTLISIIVMFYLYKYLNKMDTHEVKSIIIGIVFMTLSIAVINVSGLFLLSNASFGSTETYMIMIQVGLVMASASLLYTAYAIKALTDEFSFR